MNKQKFWEYALGGYIPNIKALCDRFMLDLDESGVDKSRLNPLSSSSRPIEPLLHSCRSNSVILALKRQGHSGSMFVYEWNSSDCSTITQIQKLYCEYFLQLYQGCQFRGKTPTEPVAIFQNDAIVGLIAPCIQRELSNISTPRRVLTIQGAGENPARQC